MDVESIEQDRSRRETAGSREGTQLTWLLILFLAWVPVPLGSNRPIFWSINAIILGFLGVFYWLSLYRSCASVRVPLKQLGLLPVLYIWVVGYLVVQFMPLPWAWRSISFTPGATALMLLRWLSYGALFFLVLQATKNRHRYTIFIDALFVVGVLHAALALFTLRNGDTLLGAPKLAYLGSATGTFVGRNSFATFAALTCCIGVAQLHKTILALHIRREVARGDLIWLRLALTCIACLIVAGALVASQSRMGVAAGAVGILVTGSILALKRIISQPLPLFLAAIIAGGCSILLFGEGLLTRLLAVEQSWDIRFALYQQVAKMIWSRPWTGFGGGSFELVYPAFHFLPVAPDRVWDKAHNTYLTLAAELGLPAALIVVGILGAVAWRLRRGLHKHENVFPIAIGLGCLAVVSVHAVIDFSMEIQAVTCWLVSISAASLAQCLEKTENVPSGISST